MSASDSDSRLQAALAAVKREDFLPSDQRARVAEDRPLPIGYEQTISQPSLVARMTRELQLARQSRVLEVGTGSGFQTALLAELAAEVYTVERIRALGEAARDRLGRLGYRNVHFRIGDGARGWEEAAPFDAIIVTAAAASVPPALILQLAPRGRMLVPVGADSDHQSLLVITKDETGRVLQQELCGVRFVPLVQDGDPAGG